MSSADISRFVIVIASVLFFAVLSEAGERAGESLPTVPGQVRAAESLLSPQEDSRPGFFDVVFKNKVATLFAILCLGLILGKVQLRGLSFGSSGVLFVALAFGHFGYTISAGIGTVGLVLFVYGVGVSAGPSFFSAFAKRGIDFVKISFIAVTTGALVTYCLASLLKIKAALAVGLFAGALTSTPGLASAIDALKDESALVSIGYGIGYPFGVIGVILFIQLLPKVLKKDFSEVAKEIEETVKSVDIARKLVEVRNPALVGKKIAEETAFFDSADCCISRLMVGEIMRPISPDCVFEIGQLILIIGKEDKLPFAIDYIGKERDEEFVIDSENERMQVVVTDKSMLGRGLGEIEPLKKYGVIISRITRNAISFVPGSTVPVEPGDILTVVGTSRDLQIFAKAAGHKIKAMHVTDIISLSAAILIGVVIGSIPIALPGLKPFSLGMAGGPLFVALVLGYFRQIGKLTSNIPVAARILLMDLGLIFFLANAGVKAGGKMMAVLSDHGVELLLVGVAITVVPMIVTYIAATVVMKLNMLEALGGICGGMTSTPALGALTAKVDSDVPVTSYATAYPVALILMTVIAQILISVLT